MNDIINKLAQANNEINQVHVRGREDATHYLTAITIIDEVLKKLVQQSQGEKKDNG